MTTNYQQALNDALWAVAPFTLPIIVILVMLFG